VAVRLSASSAGFSVIPRQDKPETDAKADNPDGSERRKRRSPPPAKDPAADFGVDSGR